MFHYAVTFFHLNLHFLIKFFSKELKGKRGCLDIQNNNEKCFLWSILALLHSVQSRNHLDRVTKCQEYESELNMSGVKYPVDIKDIDKFEHQNNISVNASKCK